MKNTSKNRPADADEMAVEFVRRVAFALCRHCGKDYDAHDPSPLEDDNDPICHQSDFDTAGPEHVESYLGRDDFKAIWARLRRGGAR